METTIRSGAAVSPRHARSKRVVTATVLSALVVVVAAVSVMTGLYAVTAVATGLAAVGSIVIAVLWRAEVSEVRTQAATDRAIQTQTYNTLTEARIAEHAAQSAAVEAHWQAFAAVQAESQAADHRSIADLDAALSAAQQRANEVAVQHNEALRQAGDSLTEAESQIALAETRAGEAMIRSHQLEVELDDALSEIARLKASLEALRDEAAPAWAETYPA